MLKVFDSRQVFNELMAALSMALDMDARGKLYHAWRVALVAGRTAKLMLPDKVSDVFYAGLLHDIGAMGLGDHIVHLMISRVPSSDPSDSTTLSEKGLQLLRNCRCLKEASLLYFGAPRALGRNWVSFTHERPELTVGGQIVAIADQLDILLRLHRWDEGKQALEVIKRRSGSIFMPEVVEAFLAAVAETPYYQEIQNYHNLPYLMEEALA